MKVECRRQMQSAGRSINRCLNPAILQTIRHDPGYIYVEAGPDFEREHTAAYADADTAKISFNNASWALAHLSQHGGSAYLPDRLIAPEIDAKRLFVLDGAPVFQRPCFMVVRDSTSAYADDITAFLNGLE